MNRPLNSHRQSVDPREVYKNYGQRHLQKSINVDLDGIKGLLNGVLSEAAGANPANSIDVSLLRDSVKF